MENTLEAKFAQLEFVRLNWKSPEAMKSLLGQKWLDFHRNPTYATYLWGTMPREKLMVNLNEKGEITRVRTWDGLGWNAHGGYGTPVVDVKL